MVAEVITAPAAAPKRKLSALIEREERRKRRRARLLGMSAVAVALLAALGWLLLRPKPVPLAARFRVQAVDRGEIVREVRATGHLEALTTVEVGGDLGSHRDGRGRLQ